MVLPSPKVNTVVELLGWRAQPHPTNAHDAQPQIRGRNPDPQPIEQTSPCLLAWVSRKEF
ncbi:MAG: hypothetical protein NT075_11605 [Chloroflexi bacterium]|nr:hypothetical protein [Chloroflexota bacterium]